ncbi:MAG: enoyl-CoA hydratase/isomerase family protein [Actinobacteria bacterium]|nr:enoyl-CoA hydratase/isomerase family protein [Actinomycetota bacterium]MBI3687978.1 enoyl-CoA hydratase/isomerase family protein [Actinomycetota bacterium]
MSDTLRIDRTDGVATLTLNRPAALNSLTVELKEALLAGLVEVRDDRAVRAVVLTGAGRAFCAGQDLREHLGLLDAADTAPLRTVEEHFNPITLALTGMPKPVVAAVNGVAAGAGASLSFAADFRIAAAGASFVLSFAKVGLSADSGVSWTLPRLVGRARATSMMMLAEPVTAADALTIGLVNTVVPDDQALATGQELAARLAAGPTLAYAAIKQTLAFAAGAPLADALANEARWQARCGATDDHRAATAAFVGRTQPVFHGR